MNIKKFKTTPVRITFLMERLVRKRYKEHCPLNDSIMSDRIRLLIEKDLNGDIIL